MTPKERELPNVGLIEMQDSETGLVATIDSSDPVTRLKYKNTYAKADAEFSKELQKRGIDGFNFSTEEDFSQKLIFLF